MSAGEGKQGRKKCRTGREEKRPQLGREGSGIRAALCAAVPEAGTAVNLLCDWEKPPIYLSGPRLPL